MVYLYYAPFFSDLYESTGEVLGEGSHGAVHCYKSKRTNAEYAVKVPTSMEYDVLVLNYM